MLRPVQTLGFAQPFVCAFQHVAEKTLGVDRKSAKCRKRREDGTVVAIIELKSIK